jgi:hypothetical protein
MSHAQEKVLISYAHESRELEERVLSLSERLRDQGVVCVIDRYFPSPPEGWALWMEREIRSATHVLVVCTEEYLRRYEREAPQGTGKGVKWEGAIIRQTLYRNEMTNTAFIPVTFGGGDEVIPLMLSDATRYDVATEEGYEALFRRITSQPDVVAAPIGPRRALPPLPVRAVPAAAAPAADATVIFADAVEPDRVSLAGAADALAAGGKVTVAWPSSTEDAYVLLRERHGRLPEFLAEHDIEDAADVQLHARHWGFMMDAAKVCHDYAARRLPFIWTGMADTGTSDRAAAFVEAGFGFLVLCNARILGSLHKLFMRDEPDHVPPEFAEMAGFLESVAGRAAFGTSEPFYRIDTSVGGRGPLEVRAPASAAVRIGRSGYTPADAAGWLMPWWELGLVGTRDVADYGPDALWVGKVVTADGRRV